ncbi:Peroxidase-like protein [Armadillidium nasatum]|uniref:Peroxidase-like protein n=1 Tax=Armadillidium nasatum TaxID=96803 RepID=A0A5N5SNS1_9CRUS|nr:Peroxidase-like protein [Armadillidium nasatum]
MNNDCFQDHFDGITVMVMQWGQFIDHDLVFTPEATDNRCCEDFRTLTPTSSNCVPIDVRGDPFYSSLSTTVNCLPFVRSRVATCTNSRNRETINERTAYLDASMVYGSTVSIANNLRTFSGGKLKAGPGSETLTCTGSTPDICPWSFLPSGSGSGGNEFFAGDSRVRSSHHLLRFIHFLFGHSLIPNAFHLSNGNIIQLAETFNNHGVTLNTNSFPSHFLGGIIDQQAMPMDQMLVDAISNKLFAQSPFEFGSDLYARNIQRGRDHGIPGYVAWHNSCVDQDPSRTINSFNDLVGRMPNCVISAFQNLYATVHDIDLFPAGIAEFEVPGGLVGPTFACIIAEYFSDPQIWRPILVSREWGQVSSISATRLSSLICLFTNVDVIQPNVMLPHGG